MQRKTTVWHSCQWGRWRWESENRFNEIICELVDGIDAGGLGILVLAVVIAVVALATVVEEWLLVVPANLSSRTVRASCRNL